MISIIIPAHDEAGVISRTLSTITEGLLPGEADVIVVCNGCTDNTADVARNLSSLIRVIETTVANKTNALNMGDRAAGNVFPRLYIDADVLVSPSIVRVLVTRLSKGDVLAVAPTPRVETSCCSWPVRWFFEVASLLPSAREGIGGSGVYALSQAGRSRFGDFPDLVADDAYVRIHFAPHECETLRSVSSIVSAPRTVRDLIRVRTRVRFGHLELAKISLEAWHTRRKSNDIAVLALFKRIPLWPKLLVYCCVTLTARAKAHRRFRKDLRIWERDRISRPGTSPSHK